MKTWMSVVAILALFAAAFIAAPAAEATVSGNNGNVAFVREVAGADQIFLINPDGTGETQVTSFVEADGDPTEISSVGWSPTGTALTFSTENPGDPGSQPAVWIINRDGTGLTFVTSGSGPSWSPDGETIAFSEDSVGQVNGLPTRVITTIDLETGVKQVVTDPGDWVHEYRRETSRDVEPAWTSNGAAIYFTRVFPGSASIFPSFLYRLDIATGEAEEIWRTGDIPHARHDTSPTPEDLVFVRTTLTMPWGRITLADPIRLMADEIPVPTGHSAAQASFGPSPATFVAELVDDAHPNDPRTVWIRSSTGVWSKLTGGRTPMWQPLNPYPVGLVDPSQGEWHLRDATGRIKSFYFGDPGDIPFMGDWDCDGTDTPGLYRQSDGFVYLRNSNTQGLADITFFFGDPGDVPLAGDFNGDGCDTVSVYRPSEARFYIINELGEDGGGLGAAEHDFIFGNPADTPFIGDFDGDGIDTPGLHRPSTGLVYYRNTNSEGVADFIFYFGDPGDRFITSDWNHDGNDSPAVFRPWNSTFFFRFTNTQGNADAQFLWGEPDWLPVAGGSSGD